MNYFLNDQSVTFLYMLESPFRAYSVKYFKSENLNESSKFSADYRLYVELNSLYVIGTYLLRWQCKIYFSG